MSKIVFFSVLSLLLACSQAKQPALSAQPPVKTKFYVNLDCLVGLSASVAFELLCTEESRAAFLSADSDLQQTAQRGMSLEVSGLWLFNVVTRDGQVISSSFSKQTSKP